MKEQGETFLNAKYVQITTANLDVLILYLLPYSVKVYRINLSFAV